MKKILLYFCFIFLLSQIAISNTGAPNNNFKSAPRFAYAPKQFKSYSSYLQYASIKAFKGIDSANAFYKKQFKEALENYTDPWLLLTGGTLTGALAGTDASFSGNVGIGTGGPNTKLEVSSDGGTIRLSSASNSNVQLNITKAYSGSHGANDDAVNITSIKAGATYQPISLEGSHAYINVDQNGTGNGLFTAADFYYNKINFNTYSSGSQTRMTILQNGNVGIGMTSPVGNFEVGSGSSSFVKVDNSIGGRITFAGSANDYINAGFFHSSGDVIVGAGGNSKVQLKDGGSVLASFDGNTNGNFIFSPTGTGKIGIGTSSPSEQLSVAGNVYASGNISAFGYVKTKKLTVTQTDWPDYVFAESYKLRSLSSLESFIRQNKHLPEMPSAKEVEEKGINVGDNQALLLKKIEELTLYMIEINKDNTLLKKEVEKLKRKSKSK